MSDTKWSLAEIGSVLLTSHRGVSLFSCIFLWWDKALKGYHGKEKDACTQKIW